MSLSFNKKQGAEQVTPVIGKAGADQDKKILHHFYLFFLDLGPNLWHSFLVVQSFKSVNFCSLQKKLPHIKKI